MKGLTGILFKLVGGPLYLPVVWKTSRPVEVAKLSVTGIHLITCLIARSFQFMSALLKYSQLMQNNGKDALTKIKDSKINLACNICNTLLLWFSMRCHIVNEVTLQKKILHYFSQRNVFSWLISLTEYWHSRTSGRHPTRETCRSTWIFSHSTLFGLCKRIFSWMGQRYMGLIMQ